MNNDLTVPEQLAYIGRQLDALRARVASLEMLESLRITDQRPPRWWRGSFENANDRRAFKLFLAGFLAGFLVAAAAAAQLLR